MAPEGLPPTSHVENFTITKTNQDMKKKPGIFYFSYI